MSCALCHILKRKTLIVGWWRRIGILKTRLGQGIGGPGNQNY